MRQVMSGGPGVLTPAESESHLTRWVESARWRRSPADCPGEPPNPKLAAPTLVGPAAVLDSEYAGWEMARGTYGRAVTSLPGAPGPFGTVGDLCRWLLDPARPDGGWSDPAPDRPGPWLLPNPWPHVLVTAGPGYGCRHGPHWQELWLANVALTGDRPYVRVLDTRVTIRPRTTPE